METEKAKTIYIPSSEDLPKPDLETPPQGKAWRRKSDGVIFPDAIIKLGKLYIKNGKSLKKPYQEKVEDFELIDIPEIQML